MNRLDPETRCRVVACLVEGNSIRATVRMTGAAKNTVVKLLKDLGKACLEYQEKTLVNLTCKRIQCDEIWSFVGAKDRNTTPETREMGWGDVWTWTAICADTKLIPCWYVGTRDANTAYHFMHNLKGRLQNRVQLTTDGHKAYLEAVEDAFGEEIDYAMLIKIFGKALNGERSNEARYSPPVCTGIRKRVISGKPSKSHVSTSFCERQNLTMRMSMRRFTRLTNAFSKKVENHEHALALYFMYYNFARIHQTLRVTPAMEAGVSNHVWTIQEIINLIS